MRPTRTSSLVFSLKANFLRLRRHLANIQSDLPLLQKAPPGEFPFVLAESVTPLWTSLLPVEADLQLGKVQNLRRATYYLNRLHIPANTTFSFWRQLRGPTTRRKGYAPGRMLQEGCIIPSVGGGLCQISNALYDVCLTAGCEILERHAHSAVIPGSAAALGRDATVAWNYVDLRFRSRTPLLLESFLTQETLTVRLRSAQQQAATQGQMALPPIYKAANSCETCGQHACFRHQDFFAGPRLITKSAFLLDECWPEFRTFIAARQQPGDLIAHPINGVARYRCPIANSHTAPLETLWRSFQTRRHAASVPRRVAAQMKGAQAIAAKFSQLLTPNVTTLYVEQSFLPFLAQNMDLGGRTVKVFMTRLPLAELHRRLDRAFALHPERTTLNELRADSGIVEAEAEALAYAHAIITPHLVIAQLFPNKSEHLPWEVPSAPMQRTAGPVSESTLAFPGPTVARKGAYELRAAARALNFTVLPLGNELEGPNFWQGVQANPLAVPALYVQPALIEDKPRMLLKAIAAGIPVIATEACGIGPGAGVHLIPALDESALTAALAMVTAA